MSGLSQTEYSNTITRAILESVKTIVEDYYDDILNMEIGKELMTVQFSVDDITIDIPMEVSSEQATWDNNRLIELFYEFLDSDTVIDIMRRSGRMGFADSTLKTFNRIQDILFNKRAINKTMGTISNAKRFKLIGDSDHAIDRRVLRRISLRDAQAFINTASFMFDQGYDDKHGEFRFAYVSGNGATVVIAEGYNDTKGVRLTNWELPYYSYYQLIIRAVFTWLKEKPQQKDLDRWIQKKLDQDEWKKSQI